MKKRLTLPYSEILVLGLAKSGTACTKVLLENGKKVRVNDMNAQETDDNVKELQAMGAEIIVGSHPLSVLEGVELVVKNPGIPYENPIIVEAEKRNLPVITEIEIAGYLANENIIGITGSNGKTTTTTLLTQILKMSQLPVQVAGNIGTVASEVASQLEENEHLVLELSSFQLMGIETFKPKIAILLNIFEAHLDYHKTIDNYIEAKSNIFINQTDEDYLIYNADDPVVCELAKQAKSITIPFSIHKRLEDGAWMDKSYIYFKEEKIIHLDDISLVGTHNLQNILASVSAAKLSGATNAGIYQVLSTFSGVKHRLQYVTNIRGRVFYNDSKATNMLATEKALSSFNQPIILLAGGLDRGNEFSQLIPYLTNVKAMVLFGETKQKLLHTAQTAGIQTTLFAENVADAVYKAYDVSDAGDVILLSPACASWDQYQTFEERGDMFVQAVHTLK